MIIRAVYIGIAAVYMLTIDSLSSISLGPISLSGAMTLAIPYLTLILLPFGLLRASRRFRHITRGAGPVVAIALFALLAVTSAALSSFEEGVQNSAVYSLFALTLAITLLFWRGESAGTHLAFLQWVAVAGSLLAVLSMSLGSNIYGIRAIGVIGLLFLALLLPYRGKNWLLKLGPFVVILALGLSLSRTALVIGVVSLLFVVVRSASRRRVMQLAAAIPVMLFAGYWLLFEYAPVRDRFLGGDAALAIGGLQINTSGRVTLWTTTFQSAMEAPLVGKGAGSSAALLNSLFNISHPHNDYLRVFHDFGFFGLVIFVCALAWLLARTWRAARRTDLPIHWAAFIGLSTTAALGITDNVFVYSFVMMPVGLLLGLSLATDADSKADLRHTREPSSSSQAFLEPSRRTEFRRP